MVDWQEWRYGVDEGVWAGVKRLRSCKSENQEDGRTGKEQEAKV
jgi:hypothetical protein